VWREVVVEGAGQLGADEVKAASWISVRSGPKLEKMLQLGYVNRCHEERATPAQGIVNRIPLEIQAALWVVVNGYEQRIAALEAQVAALQAQLKQNSQNSSRPPSSDGPQVSASRPIRPRTQAGGPAGHPVSQRVLVPVERCRKSLPASRRTAAAVGPRWPARIPAPPPPSDEVPPPVPQ